MLRAVFGLVGLAASAFGVLGLAITLTVPDLVRCGVNPFNITLTCIVGLIGAPLLALCCMKSKKVRLVWLAYSISSFTLCIAWTWLLSPYCPVLSRWMT